MKCWSPRPSGCRSTRRKSPRQSPPGRGRTDGTRVKLVETQGAARLHTKTVEEMAADRPPRPNAGAADKGKMTKK